MDKVLILDTAVASTNRGDDIIMECVNKELAPITKGKFVYTLPTHVSPFHWYQVVRNSYAVQKYSNCELKFAGGSNLLVKDMLTHYPQWNINWFNCAPLRGLVLLGIGAGAGDKSNAYTRHLYRRVLSHDFVHSVRDERSRAYVESLGLKALNTGCVTMWQLTPDFCRQIPTRKTGRVVFTLTSYAHDLDNQYLIDTLRENYAEVYFWPQGDDDLDFLKGFRNTEGIKVLEATKEAYDEYLTKNDTDYVGTRLHGGIYAMRHKRRAIIIAIDERAREIHKCNNLPCVDKNDIRQLDAMINGELVTDVKMPLDDIAKWRSQFIK